MVDASSGKNGRQTSFLYKTGNTDQKMTLSQYKTYNCCQYKGQYTKKDDKRHKTDVFP